MKYSQKYTIVQFFENVDEGESFSMYEWPSHTTFADVFAVDRTDALMDDLQSYVNTLQPTTTYIKSESAFGDTPIWLLNNSKELLQIHLNMVDILERHGAVFNTPEFTRGGYIPHITKQKNKEMHVGDKLTVHQFSIVDMFPGGDWQKRKVLKTFRASSQSPVPQADEE